MVTMVKRQEIREGPTGIRYSLPQQIQAWEADWAAYQGVANEDHGAVEVNKGRARAVDAEPNPEKKARFNEAVAFIRDYRGSWGFILDLKADRKWGSAYFRLSDRQVEVVLNAKARDAARESDPRLVAIKAWLRVQPARREGFLANMQFRLGEGQDFSPGMLNALERMKNEQGATALSKDAAEPITDGIYRTPDGTIIKVQKAVNGSGNLYGKRLVIEADHGEFVYEPGLLRKLTAAMKLTLEDAAAFGRLYGWCMICGRTLTDEGSIARGIGPVCAGRMG